LEHQGLKAEFSEEGKLIVSSDFWEVIHDPEKGGCITNIKFYHGRNKNILLSPISSHFGSFFDFMNEKAIVRKEENKNIKIIINGELADLNKYTKANIKYEYIYEYNLGYIKIKHKYYFEKGIAGIRDVGIACMDIVPDLDKFAARPSHISADLPHATCPAKWGHIHFNDEAAFQEKNIPLYMAVFKPGVEGIEFLPGSDLEEWTKQLIEEVGIGSFQIRGVSQPKSVRFVIQPVVGRGLCLSGEYKFTFYLGLPKIPKKMSRKYMHMSFNNHPWPSDEEIRKWAYSGVNIVRLHNDYHPSGYFWHDGSWPPYDEKGMEELKRVIDTCHRYGIKIVPYFSLYEINPKSDAFADGYILWRRVVDDRGSLIETYPPHHYYGFGMCLSSGWKEFLKDYVKKVIKTLGFDGVYYDYAHYWACRNNLHKRGYHSIIDDVIDLLEYTREIVGKEGVILLHQSGWFPCVLIENYADGHIMFEDNVHWRQVPPLNQFTPNTLHLTFMNVAPKIPVPAVGADRLKGMWDLCSKCSLMGAFPYGHIGPEAESVLKLFEVFRAFDLSKYQFKDYTTEIVKTNNEAIKGAVYFNDERVLVVLANVSDEPVANFKWTVDLKSIGWDKFQEYHLTDSLGQYTKIANEQDITLNGINDSLEAFRFKVIVIAKYKADQKYVLYNTRPWTERYKDNRLTIETSGPIGQEAFLKFYSPSKPQEIKINSVRIKDDLWIWDHINKIGTLNYSYEETQKNVVIEILF